MRYDATPKKGTENGWQFVTLFIFPQKKAFFTTMVVSLLRLQSYLRLDIFFGPWVVLFHLLIEKRGVSTTPHYKIRFQNWRMGQGRSRILANRPFPFADWENQGSCILEKEQRAAEVLTKVDGNYYARRQGARSSLL